MWSNTLEAADTPGLKTSFINVTVACSIRVCGLSSRMQRYEVAASASTEKESVCGCCHVLIVDVDVVHHRQPALPVPTLHTVPSVLQSLGGHLLKVGWSAVLGREASC